MRFLVLACLAASSLAAPAKRQSVTPPSQDPFYQVPSNVSSYTNGQIIASRQVQTAVLTLVPTLAIGATSYQLLYRTTDALGNATATVGTLILPDAAVRQADRLVGYAPAEDSSYINCPSSFAGGLTLAGAPSYNFRLDASAPNSNFIVQAEQFLVDAILASGLPVMIADYEGPQSAFSAGRMAGHAVLDSLCAAVNFKPAGLSMSTVRLGQAGYSGGSIATGWAAALQPSYAPELPVAGFALGGVVANLSLTLQFLDGTSGAGFAFAGLGGLLYQYKDLNAYWESIATQAGKDAVTFTRSHCGESTGSQVTMSADGDDINHFKNEVLESTKYQSTGAQLLYQPQVQKVMQQNIISAPAYLPKELPSKPLYVYHSTSDMTIPFNGTVAMVNRMCNAGIKSLQFTEATGGESHAELEFLAFPAVLSWLNDRLAGKPAQSGCSTTQAAFVTPNPGSFPLAVQPVIAALVTFLTANKAYFSSH